MKSRHALLSKALEDMSETRHHAGVIAEARVCALLVDLARSEAKGMLAMKAKVKFTCEDYRHMHRAERGKSMRLLHFIRNDKLGSLRGRSPWQSQRRAPLLRSQ
jgi:hypothetical protein